MSYNLRPHTTHVIEYGDVCCSKEMVDQTIDILMNYGLHAIAENTDYSEYEIYEGNFWDAIKECEDDNLKNTLRELYDESDKRDGYIHFSVF